MTEPKIKYVRGIYNIRIPCWMMIVHELRKLPRMESSSMSELSKRSDRNIYFTMRVIKSMIAAGIVESEKRGKYRMIRISRSAQNMDVYQMASIRGTDRK